MFRKRSVAAKLAIQDIQDGELIANDQGNVVGVETFLGQVSRVNIIASVVDRYQATQDRLDGEEKGFATITLDDGSGVIRTKMWGELAAKLAHIEVGDLVVVVGRIRSFQGETYINGEVVRRLEDPNWETVRLLELKHSRDSPHQLKGQVMTASPETIIDESIPEKSALEKGKQKELEPGVWHTATATLEDSEDVVVPSPELRRIVLETIQKHDAEGGARFEQILDVTGDEDEEVVEQVLIDLLSEGLVYEPEMRRFRKS
jgi:RPA family protein